MTDENLEERTPLESPTEEEYLRNVYLEVSSSALAASLPALIYGTEVEGLMYESDYVTAGYSNSSGGQIPICTAALGNKQQLSPGRGSPPLMYDYPGGWFPVLASESGQVLDSIAEEVEDVEQEKDDEDDKEEEKEEGSTDAESSYEDEPDQDEEKVGGTNSGSNNKSQCQVKIAPLSEMWATMKPYSGSSKFNKPWAEKTAKSEAGLAQARRFRPRPRNNEGMSRINVSTSRPNQGRSSLPVGRERGGGGGPLRCQNRRNESQTSRLGAPGNAEIAAVEVGRPQSDPGRQREQHREQAPAQVMQGGNKPVQGNQGSNNNMGRGVPNGSSRGRFGSFWAGRGRAAAPPNLGFNGGIHMPDPNGNNNFGPTGRQTAASVPAASLNNFNPGGRNEPKNFDSGDISPRRFFGKVKNFKTSSNKIPVPKPGAPLPEDNSAELSAASTIIPADSAQRKPTPADSAQRKPTPADSSPAAPVKSTSSAAPRKKSKRHGRNRKSSSGSASSPTSTDASVPDEVFTAAAGPPSKSGPRSVSLVGSTVAPTAKTMTQEQKSTTEGSADDAGSVPNPSPGSEPKKGNNNASSKVFKQLDPRYQYRQYRCPDPACRKSWYMVTNGKMVECTVCQTEVHPWEDPALGRLKGKPSSRSQFRCPFQGCRNDWESRRAFIGYPQPCDNCGTIVYAYRETPFQHY